MTLRGLVGTTAPVAYRALLLANPKLEKITVCRYSTPPLLQQRIRVGPFEQRMIDRALELRAETKIPFWQAVFSACILAGECSQSLVDATFVHAGQGTIAEYERRDLETGILEQLTAGASNVALGSKVFESGRGWVHLCLLDFHCEISEPNMRIAHQVCRALMPEGFLLLDSGDSYHACSMDLSSGNDRIRLLGKALLASPIVDAVYIAHQLQQEGSSIRISRGGKERKVPIVVDAWCPDDRSV